MLLIGDAHIKVNNLLAGKQLLDWLRTVIDERKPSVVVNLGDLMDNHAVIRAEVLAEYRAFIDYVCGVKGLQYFHILGNHEMYRPNDGTYHALQAMKAIYPCFYVVDHRMDIANMTFVPYHFHASQFPTDTREILFAHQTFIGADYGTFRPDGGVDADEIAAEFIVSGHIHKQQRVGKVFYPGSPMAASADDVDQVKGVFLFNPDTYATEFIESPFPRWRSWTMAEGALSTAVSDLAAVITSGDHWIVNLSGPRVELNALLDSPDFKKLRESHSIRVRTKYIDRDKARAKVTAPTQESAVMQYIDAVYAGDLDKTNLKKLALELLNKTKS